MFTTSRRTGSAAAGFAALPSPFLLLLEFLAIFATVVALHATLLHLPYFWDEGGYYVPAALDFFHRGAPIPEFTNAHPPLPNILIGSAWHLFGFHIIVTRVLVCAIAAGALLAVLRLARLFLSPLAAFAVCLLTGVYSIWYTQSSLAHADIFAALFTLWGLVFFFAPESPLADSPSPSAPQRAANAHLAALAILFSLAALCKETSILQPVALAALELTRFLRAPRSAPFRRTHALRAIALAAPVLPLAAWFGYHRLRTGFTFGNPEFLRYNATANLTVAHVASSLRYRFLHLFWQRDMWVPLLLAALCFLWPRKNVASAKAALPRRTLETIAVLVAANWLAFSILGGALLTRYLLPIYPLLLLVCVAVWRWRTRLWPLLAAAAAVIFISSWWLNPPTYFAPEDNLTYRDMIVVHEEAIHFVRTHYPEATILTAWPVAADLVRPELGYIDRSLHVTSIDNFTQPEIQRAAQEPGRFDTAIVFTTHFVSPAFSSYLNRHPRSRRTREYNRTRDLTPAEIAARLGGQVVWQHNLGGEWAAVLRFPRSYEALNRFPPTR